jgi:GT2 family glycosyltransferase
MADTRFLFVSATRGSEHEFFERSALGRSLIQAHGEVPAVDVRVYPGNREGLPVLYNDAIRAAHPEAVLVFAHDDLLLVDFMWPEKLVAALDRFAIVGLVGNRRRAPRQPTWAHGESFERDLENLSGIIGHGMGFPCAIRRLGDSPAECLLLDGVFLAMRVSTLRSQMLLFDERFRFHFYDMDFCREAARKGVRMGTFPIFAIHESVGGFGSEAWQEDRRKYLKKWGD